MVKRLAMYMAVALFMFTVSCNVSERTLTNADQRIKALKSKGVPDSSLSAAKVALYQSRELKTKSATGESRSAAKQMRIELAKAEALYRDNIAKLRPAIDSLRAIIQNARSNYNGMILKKVDSLNGIVDSFIRIEWLLQAHSQAQLIVDRIPELNFDMERTKELRDRIPGEWVCATKIKGSENKDINAVETKTFIFGKDGKTKFIESKKGQTGPYLKEDWEFVSTGTWDINGDTLNLFIHRFAAVKQMFMRLSLENGKKKSWKKEPQPTYDSAITDGSQDRYITFSDLKEDFNQVKKY